jgi:hypothetical protein
MARNKNQDDLWDSLSDPAWVLLSDAWETDVNLEQYQKLIDGKARQLSFHSVLNPEVFEGYERYSEMNNSYGWVTNLYLILHSYQIRQLDYQMFRIV